MAFYDKNSYLENDVIGNFLNENCPKCGATLLGNKRGDKWCSNAGGVGTSVCEYGLKDEPSDQQIITELAKKVMGWHREIHFRDLEDQYGDTYWVDKTGLAVAKDGLWNPLKNIADAWMIVEKIKDNDEQKRHFSAWLALTTGTNSIFGVTPKAISMAAYRLVA